MGVAEGEFGCGARRDDWHCLRFCVSSVNSVILSVPNIENGLTPVDLQVS